MKNLKTLNNYQLRLWERLLLGSDPFVSEDAASITQDIHTPEMTERLKILLKNPKSNIQDRALSALRWYAVPELENDLIKLLKDYGIGSNSHSPVR